MDNQFMDDSARRQRLAMLLSWRAMRRSVARGKVMSLPNLLRLYQRRCADAGVQPDQTPFGGMDQLRRTYQSEQPFHPGDRHPQRLKIAFRERKTGS